MATVTHQHAHPGRVPEFFLTIVAVAVGLSAYCLVYLGATDDLPPNLAQVAVVFGIASLAAHIIIRATAPYADPVLFPTAVALNGIGLAMIARIDIRLEHTDASRQALFTLLGLVISLATLLLVRDHRLLRKFTWTALVASIVLIMLPLLPGLGQEIYGSRIWIHIGSYSFQPAEIAKITLAIFFAGYLVVNRDNLALAGPKVLGLHLPRLRHFAPLLAAWAVCLAVLIFQKDLGTSLLFFGLFVAILYVATDRLSWIIIGGLLALAGGAVVVSAFPHVSARFTIWLHALDPDVYNAAHGSYQVVQGQFGMAAGGLFGSGLGRGYPFIVPQANSDFIIASLGEEIGMVGIFALLALYLILVVRGLRTAAYVRDGFGKLLATGLSVIIALQVFVVVGGVTRLIPLTGLTMPFLALGGSSLLCNWIIIGLLLRISDAARRPHIRSSEPLPPAWEDQEAAGVDRFEDEENAAVEETDTRPTEAVKLS